MLCHDWWSPCKVTSAVTRTCYVRVSVTPSYAQGSFGRNSSLLLTDGACMPSREVTTCETFVSHHRKQQWSFGRRLFFAPSHLPEVGLEWHHVYSLTSKHSALQALSCWQIAHNAMGESVHLSPSSSGKKLRAFKKIASRTNDERRSHPLSPSTRATTTLL